MSCGPFELGMHARKLLWPAGDVIAQRAVGEAADDVARMCDWVDSAFDAEIDRFLTSRASSK